MTKEQFLRYVEVRGPLECWPCHHRPDKDGYGRIPGGQRGKAFRANRLAYELFNGTLKPGEVVRHSCDNPCCCNPAHLEAGTQADNLMDMHRRQRHPGTRLNADQVKAIRTDRRVGKQIAATYGVSQGTVYAVKSGRIWKHV